MNYCDICHKELKTKRTLINHYKSKIHNKNKLKVEPKIILTTLSEKCIYYICCLNLLPFDIINLIIHFYADIQDVWWYYNRNYSQTGGLFLSPHDAIKYIKEDGYYCDILPSILKDGHYMDFSIQLQKINFNGNLLSVNNLTSFYILRYPNALFIDEDAAYKTGVLEVLAHKSSYRRANCYKHRHRSDTLIKCNDQWLNSFDKGNGIDWAKVWRVRIEEDSWNTPNHIECVDDTYRFKNLL
jgi:hypothetical protein